MSIAGPDAAISLAAAQNVRINIQGIAEGLKKQDARLSAWESAPSLSAEQLQLIQDVEAGIRDAGNRITVLRRTGLATAGDIEDLNDLNGIQQEMMGRIQSAVETRICTLTQSLREQSHALSYQIADLRNASTPLKQILAKLKEIGAEIDALRRMPAPHSEQEVVGLIQGSLGTLNAHLQQQIRRANSHLDAISRRSTLALDGLDKLRLPFDLHSRVGSFVPPSYQPINTRSRDDDRVPATRPHRNAFELAVKDYIQFIEDNKDEDQELEQLERDRRSKFKEYQTAFTQLPPREKAFMSQLFCQYLARADLDANKWILELGEGDIDIINAVISASIAMRELEKFYAGIKSLDFDKAKEEDKAKLNAVVKKHWNDALANSWTRDGIMRAVWILRGCPVDEEQLGDPYNFLTTVGNFDKVVVEACRRLLHNNFGLLHDHKALEPFTMMPYDSDVNLEEFRASYRELKNKSPDTAALLAFAVGNSIGTKSEGGEHHILTANEEAVKKILFLMEKVNYFVREVGYIPVDPDRDLSNGLIQWWAASPAGAPAFDGLDDDEPSMPAGFGFDAEASHGPASSEPDPDEHYGLGFDFGDRKQEGKWPK